ncbi:hypothetical protein BU24DRAFT_111234 [Aaosphaeria arxii CBS 175.79]|uniref:Uncharacterized protein n=1 Tax=Aaosphaeria arxii CBS 175.79 TaxID=1450172 RepID=A0A6A5Y383_9PLEO|nr:uncharacterized protein BU24DRAFT_111234 [Aaosphaeria arxii CBS 175.79]KAF2019044.1 hypothetical protein BU24DRAFT_111234 [Aaosphaeria arxii CBS 175.79]
MWCCNYFIVHAHTYIGPSFCTEKWCDFERAPQRTQLYERLPIKIPDSHFSLLPLTCICLCVFNHSLNSYMCTIIIVSCSIILCSRKPSYSYLDCRSFPVQCSLYSPCVSLHLSFKPRWLCVFSGSLCAVESGREGHEN